MNNFSPAGFFKVFFILGVTTYFIISQTSDILDEFFEDEYPPRKYYDPNFQLQFTSANIPVVGTDPN